MRARYFPGAEGRAYLYSSDATWRCPNAIRETPERDPWETARLDLVYALRALGLDAFKLMAAAHRGRHNEDPDERGRCRACGAKLEKVGYRTWVEDREKADYGPLVLRRVVAGSERYWPTKREAIAWCREEAAIHLAGARS